MKIWDIYFFPINEHVTMVDELTSSLTGSRQSHAVYHIVQTGLKHGEKNFPGYSEFGLRLFKSVAKLLFS